MKKFTTITIALMITLFCGIVFVFLGSHEIIDKSIFVGIGTGFISSAIVSIVTEVIYLNDERRRKQRETKVFFHQYRKSFMDFRNGLPYIYERLLCDGEKHDFATYIEQILNMELYDDLESQEGINFRDEIIYDISFFVEKIKFAVESLLTMEMEVMNNEIIYSNFSLIKQLYGNCKRALQNLKGNRFTDAISSITKMQEKHIKLFPTLKSTFEEKYGIDD